MGEGMFSSLGHGFGLEIQLRKAQKSAFRHKGKKMAGAVLGFKGQWSLVDSSDPYNGNQR